ncbi:hypothetical protein [Latilactobacillus phage TMW 1.706 P2]|nr:hypothetical protein [Latilactobacillus phage TMW 1.706 P2]
MVISNLETTTNRIVAKNATVAKMEIVQVKDYSFRYKFENPELLEAGL